MEYSIIDSSPASIACVSFMAREKNFMFLNQMSLWLAFFFFHIVKTAAGINNQLSTTKPNIKEYPACVSVTSFPFYFTF